MPTNRASGWDTLCSIAGAFSLLIALTYLVLWRESNRNGWMLDGSVLLFFAASALSRNRALVAAVACGFSGLRFVIAAVGSMSPALAVIAAVLLAIRCSLSF